MAEPRSTPLAVHDRNVVGCCHATTGWNRSRAEVVTSGVARTRVRCAETLNALPTKAAHLETASPGRGDRMTARADLSAGERSVGLDPRAGALTLADDVVLGGASAETDD